MAYLHLHAVNPVNPSRRSGAETNGGGMESDSPEKDFGGSPTKKECTGLASRHSLNKHKQRKEKKITDRI